MNHPGGKDGSAVQRGLGVVLADNPSPFTLDGTRTYLVGERRVALIDPGPDSVAHIDRLVDVVSGVESLTVLLTHGHADHAGGLERLVVRLREEDVTHDVRGVGHDMAVPFALNEDIETDRGSLSAVAIPGHAREHLAFLWSQDGGLFVGDHFLGVGDTTWVGEYPGCVADYLASLESVRELAPSVLYPAHGPPILEVDAAIDRYERHRWERIEQARKARVRWPGATIDQLMAQVYGDLPPGVGRAALMSLQALIEFVDTEERR